MESYYPCISCVLCYNVNRNTYDWGYSMPRKKQEGTSVAEVVVSHQKKQAKALPPQEEEVILPKRKAKKTEVNMSSAVSAAESNSGDVKNQYRLTFSNDEVDIRYGLLLKYFPKGGELKLPGGTCETGYYVAANKHITKIHFPASMETIGHGSFFHCENLKSLTLGENVAMISAMAFSECKGLCEVVLNSGLKEIGKKAFSGCQALEAITIPKSVAYIGHEAFKDCVNLVYVKMPQKTQLAPTAFDNCHIDLKFEYY